MKTLPIIGVMGSGSNAYYEWVHPLGVALASLEVHLLTGGGQGIMSSVSEGFTSVHNRQGLSIGIIPGSADRLPYSTKKGYPNSSIELPIYTHLPLSGDQGTSQLSRNHINILTSTVIIALPGGEGTKSEVSLALQYEKPVYGFCSDKKQLENYGSIPVFDDLKKLLDQIKYHLK